MSTVTHIGGLFSGLLVGFFIKRFSLIQKTHSIGISTDENFDNHFQQGMRQIANLEFDDAKNTFKTLLLQYPDNIKLLKQLFVIAKLKSDVLELSKYTNAILKQKCSNALCIKTQNDTFLDYFSVKKDELDLDPVIIAHAAARLFKSGKIMETEQAVDFMLNTCPDEKHIPRLLSTLAIYLHKHQQPEKTKEYLQILFCKYSHTDEAKSAKTLFN